jgi:hypothetical protein
METEATSDSTLICRGSGELDLDGEVTLRHLFGDFIRPGLAVLLHRLRRSIPAGDLTSRVTTNAQTT